MRLARRERGKIDSNPGSIAMIIRSAALSASIAVIVLNAVQPAQALTMKECSAKYKAAQSAGTLNGMKWNDFRKAQCGSDASAAPAATPTAAPATTTAPAPKPAMTTAAKPAPTGDAVFPSAVSQKYSNESAGTARRHTCLDQYNANKATNANGGLNWIQKGGGYYSECNKRLKG
jgi:hypothetical protein